MPSRSVAVLGSNAIPLEYIVPVAGTLTAIAAAATFDGTAAAAFVPALGFYDNDGNLIARAVGTEVAAGGSAEVSFFPRVAQPATSSSGGGGILAHDELDGSYSSNATNYASAADVFATGLALVGADGTSTYKVSIYAPQWGVLAPATYRAHLGLGVDGDLYPDQQSGGFATTVLGYGVLGASCFIVPAAGDHTLNVRGWTNDSAHGCFIGSGGAYSPCYATVELAW